MKHLVTSSAFALAFAGGWASPLVAQDESTNAQELAAIRAEMARLAARVETLEAELEEAQAAAETPAAPVAVAVAPAEQAPAPSDGSPTIAFSGAPEIEGEDGWSFKPRGRLQYDAGFTSVPDATGRDDGFGSEARRARLGVSGSMPGGFGYKFEVDFAGGEVAVADALISYENGDLELSVGQFNNFQSLEELTSSLHTSFIERAAFTDAFGFERRVGAAAAYESGDILVQAGLFTDNMDDLSNENWGADGRIVFMPKLGETQLHVGGSAHYADLESGQNVRYRQRPLVHFTSERFIDTGAVFAEAEYGLGLEAAAIAGPFHAAAEGFWQTVDRLPGLGDPTFFGGYAEIGMFLTPGDTRGYQSGKFDRTKPERTVGEGGIGSIQINARYDYLDLTEEAIAGGKQNGYFLSLIWKPTDWALLLANYGRLSYDGAIYPAFGGDRSYDVDAFGVRAQIDF